MKLSVLVPSIRPHNLCVDCKTEIHIKSHRCVPCRNRVIAHNNLGDKSKQWKGDNASYQTKHQMINRHYGKAFMCENDQDHIGFYEWANISGEYLRDREDWMMLCHSCNLKMDNRKRNKKGQYV